jgi:hypothetical protein
VHDHVVEFVTIALVRHRWVACLLHTAMVIYRVAMVGLASMVHVGTCAYICHVM